MIRTAMIAFSYYPADTRIRREAEALVDQGMSVDIICLKAKHQTEEENINGVNAYLINLKKKRGSKFRYFFEYGCFIIVAFLKLSVLHFRRKYDVIHVHNLPDILVLSALVPKLTGAKIILDMHEIMPEFFMRKYQKNEGHKSIKLIKLFEKISIKCTDHIITATPFLKEIVSKRSSSADRCTTILNLSDSKYFIGEVPQEPRKNGKFKIVYPGTLSELHGIDIAINAIKLVVMETDIPIEFHIYGTGFMTKEWQRLASQIKDLGLTNFVKLNKFVRIEELVPILKTMDAGVVPKRDGMFAGDAMSTKLFDFAAIGLPVIVSRTRGDSLYFDDSMVLFFEPENERQLADRIIYLYYDSDLQKNLSKNIKLLNSRLNWEIMKKKLYAIYDELIYCDKCIR
jgi:glycosyltransferase involved in cell wall biosynthesis